MLGTMHNYINSPIRKRERERERGGGGGREREREGGGGGGEREHRITCQPHNFSRSLLSAHGCNSNS